jgi:hypothetical protein
MRHATRKLGDRCGGSWPQRNAYEAIPPQLAADHFQLQISGARKSWLECPLEVKQRFAAWRPPR